MENAPPVTTAVPYNKSHIPAIAPVNPACTSTSVKSAPTNMGGAKLYTNRRPGPEKSEEPDSRAFV